MGPSSPSGSERSTPTRIFATLRGTNSQNQQPKRPTTLVSPSATSKPCKNFCSFLCFLSSCFWKISVGSYSSLLTVDGYLGPGSLPSGLVSRRNRFDDGASDISSVISSNMDYSGMTFKFQYESNH